MSNASLAVTILMLTPSILGGIEVHEKSINNWLYKAEQPVLLLFVGTEFISDCLVELVTDACTSDLTLHMPIQQSEQRRIQIVHASIRTKYTVHYHIRLYLWKTLILLLTKASQMTTFVVIAYFLLASF